MQRLSNSIINQIFKENISLLRLCHLIPFALSLSQLKEEVMQAKCSAAESSDLQVQLEESRRRASLLERQLAEQGAECRESASLRRELENLKSVTQSQEQRAAQSQAELSNLEAILSLLHLREVQKYNTDMNIVVVCFPMSHVFVKIIVPQRLTQRIVTSSVPLFP